MKLRVLGVLFFGFCAVGCDSNPRAVPVTNPLKNTGVAPAAPFTAEQEACTEVDTTDRFGSIRDQSNTEFCYAFAAADLLGEAIDLPSPDKISAYDLITNYISLDGADRERANKKLIEWNLQWMIKEETKSAFQLLDRGRGYPALLMAKAISDGQVCTEVDLPSQRMRYGYDEESIDTFINQTLLADAGIDKNFYLANQAPKPKPETSPDLFPFPLLKQNQSSLPPVVQLSPIVSNWEALKIRKAALNRCHSFHPIYNLKNRMINYNEKNEVHQKLFIDNSQLLLDNKHPFIIEYNACALTRCWPEEIKSHASVVVGRHWNKKNKTCEAKIRNSWGNSCVQHPNDVACKEGYYWVSFKTLAKYTWAIDFLMTQ